MYKIKFTNAYKKSYQRLLKRGVDISLLDEVVDNLRQGIVLDPKFKNHMLKGKFTGYYECHIKPDWLLVYLIEDKILTLTLIDTGSHADLFDM